MCEHSNSEAERLAVLERDAPQPDAALRERAVARSRRRPCGRDGYCCACWLAEQRRSGQVAFTRHEPAPWRYHPGDIRYARDWPYTLVGFYGGLKMRVYDWELEHA